MSGVSETVWWARLTAAMTSMVDAGLQSGCYRTGDGRNPVSANTDVWEMDPGAVLVVWPMAAVAADAAALSASPYADPAVVARGHALAIIRSHLRVDPGGYPDGYPGVPVDPAGWELAYLLARAALIDIEHHHLTVQ